MNPARLLPPVDLVKRGYRNIAQGIKTRYNQSWATQGSPESGKTGKGR